MKYLILLSTLFSGSFSYSWIIEDYGSGRKETSRMNSTTIIDSESMKQDKNSIKARLQRQYDEIITFYCGPAAQSNDRVARNKALAEIVLLQKALEKGQ
jgi:hypothetical protein